jgi:TonB-dependent receptor
MPAFAAEEAADDVEVIEIKGIRGSLIRAMDVKRESAGVVDAISAEDMGKFPDTNLAESLQRITGVSIDRRNGEGSTVTVRGFGADYNMVTLNGRTMPTSQLSRDGGLGGRAFDMSNLASESVAGVEVYKTSQAKIATGGIGATINIQTNRPLNNPGFNATFGAKAIMDTTNERGDDITPEVSGLVSWTDDSETFGVALSLSHQRRDNSESGAYTAGGWRTTPWTGKEGLPQTPQDISTVNVSNSPALSTDEKLSLYALPASMRYLHRDVERERQNGQLTLQYRPIESFTATLDYTFANQETEENSAELAIWMDTYKTDFQFNDAVVASPVYMWEERREQNARDMTTALQANSIKNENESIGLNLEWQVNDDFKLAFDVHNSTAESSPNNGIANRINQSIGSNVERGQGIDYSGKLPVVVWDFDDCDPTRGLNCNGKFDVADLGSQARQMRYDNHESEITQIRLDGLYEFDGGSIAFGLERRENETHQTTAEDYLETGGWGVANPGDIPADMVEEIDFSKLLSDYRTDLTAEGKAFFSAAAGEHGSNVAPMMTGFYGDTLSIVKYLAQEYGETVVVDNPNNVDRRIEEDSTAIYIQAKLNGELANRPFNAVLGVRHEKTDVTSTDQVNPPEALTWLSNNDFSANPGATTIFAQGKSDYEYLLPSLDFDLEIIDDLVARMSFGKTIGRPNFGDLSPAATGLGGPSLPTTLSGSVPGSANVGDPGLLPLESDNFDLSAEWYFADSSYVSIGYFEKRVKNFVGRAQENMSHYGITDPTNGPRVEKAIADLAALDVPLTDTSLFSMVCANSLGEGYLQGKTHEDYEQACDFTGSDNDRLAMFRTNIPVNNRSAKIYGFELAAQHFFGETGFGFQANYTIVNGDIGYDVGADPTVNQFALTGLSDSANLVGIYDKDGIQARLAWNWRDEFLYVGGVNPGFTEDYSQWDLSIGYEVNENFTVSFEGINITEEDKREHDRTNAMFTRLEVYGARYGLSARYTF